MASMGVPYPMISSAVERDQGKDIRKWRLVLRGWKDDGCVRHSVGLCLGFDELLFDRGRKSMSLIAQEGGFVRYY